MALLTDKEFAADCGVDISYLRVYIGRNSVVMADGLIDDTLPKNIKFRETRLLKQAKKEKEVKSERSDEEKMSRYKTVEISETTDKIPSTVRKKKSPDPNFTDLKDEKTALEIEKLQEEIEKLQHTNAKLAGDNIPTALVQEVFIRHNKNFVSSFKSGMENWITEIEKKYGLAHEDATHMRGELIENINTWGLEALGETKKDLKLIVKQTTIKRGVGERL
jgi:hypothetical protein